MIPQLLIAFGIGITIIAVMAVVMTLGRRR